MRFKEFKLNLLTEAILDEVSMSPTSLQRWADSPDAEGMLMGIEFEMCVPGDGFDREFEPDYSHDPLVYSVEEILDFYDQGEHSNLTYHRSQVEQSLMELYQDWYFEAISEYIDNNPGTLSMYLFEEISNLIEFEDYVDKAREELGDHAQDEDVQELAHKLHRDDIDTIISDEMDIYEEALDLARARIEEEMQDASLLSEKRWLRDVGVSRMTDAMDLNDYLQWPLFEDDGVIEGIGNDFATAIGEPVHTNSGYHGGGRGRGLWIIEPDSSIDCDHPDDKGLEFISPPQSISETLRQLSELHNWANSKQCYTNESTGLHMNISIPDYSIEKLDFIKLALFMGDKYILDQFDRTTNNYCRSAIDIIKRGTTSENVNQVLIKMRQHLNVAASKLIHQGWTAKYTSINTQDGYVEFRGPGGDYLNKSVTELTNTALRLAMALNIACDENAHKEEYAKKLYKLIAVAGPKDNTIDLFVDFTSGKLSQADLKAYLRQRQAGRANQKELKNPNASKVAPATHQGMSQPGTSWHVTNNSTGQSSTISANNLEDARFVVRTMTGMPSDQYTFTRANDAF